MISQQPQLLTDETPGNGNIMDSFLICKGISRAKQDVLECSLACGGSRDLFLKSLEIGPTAANFFTIPHTHTIHKMINQFRYSATYDLEEFRQPRARLKIHST